jgi:hypothetical protein
MKHLLKLLFLGVLLCGAIVPALIACGETTDCSLTGRPSPRFNFVNDSTMKVKKLDSLSVIALNTIIGDSIILNNEKSASSATIPLSYTKSKTVFVFKYSKSVSDTIWVTHTNTEHFLSIECGMTMYYKIDSVKHTFHAIDSVAIINSGVDVNEKENIRVFY